MVLHVKLAIPTNSNQSTEDANKYKMTVTLE